MECENRAAQASDAATFKRTLHPKRHLWRSTAHVQSNWWATTLNGTCREPEDKKSQRNLASWRQKVTHRMCVQVEVTSVDDPHTGNENNRNTTKSAPMLRKIQQHDKHELSKREGSTKHGTRKGSHDHLPPWFEKQCQAMHAEVGFKLHPLADSDPQTSAAENTDTKVKTQNVEKNDIDMKQGSRKGSQGHPPPWFKTHCQVVNAEIRFVRHPRADADPQSSTNRQKFPRKQRKS